MCFLFACGWHAYRRVRFRFAGHQKAIIKHVKSAINANAGINIDGQDLVFGQHGDVMTDREEDKMAQNDPRKAVIAAELHLGTMLALMEKEKDNAEIYEAAVSHYLQVYPHYADLRRRLTAEEAKVVDQRHER